MIIGYNHNTSLKNCLILWKTRLFKMFLKLGDKRNEFRLNGGAIFLFFMANPLQQPSGFALNVPSGKSENSSTP
jgi:hypothetical protein